MNTIESVTQALKSKFGDAVKATDTLTGNRLVVDIDGKKVKDISKEIMSLGARYMVSIGYDNISRDKTLGLIHTYAFDKEHFALMLRTSAPADNPVLDSITPDTASAGWSEREYMDLLGFKFQGHPKPKKLVTADDWPDGIYPLLKEVPYNLVPPAAENVAYQLDEAPEGTTTIPIGPFHSSLHEPNHWALYVDGETIKGCDYRGFMTHRGIEKMCQTQLSYNEIPFVAERICGICGSVHACCYAQAVEAATGMVVPKRAEFIRTIMLEIERLHSHLLWLGVAGHLIGFDTVFMQAWRVREQIMWFCEKLTGNRKTYGMIVIGGVRRDITPDLRSELEKMLKNVEGETITIHKAIAGDTAIHKRTKNVGYITKEETIKWSLVGPVARARGVDIDVRRDHPYASYGDVKFDVPVVDTCDVWGTVLVRVLEIYESIKIIRQCLEKMPEGPIMIEVPEALPALKHMVMMVEAPRGESTHYVITGEENRPERWRVRAPTYPNLQGVPSMLMNNQFADFPIILGSIDPCFSCTDRVAVIDVRTGRKSLVGKRELEELSRKYKK